MGTDTAILTLLARESARIAELEAVVAEQNQTIAELREALDNAASAPG